MNKQIFAMLALAASGSAAIAQQSSVEIYGVVDAGIRHESNLDNLGASKVSMSSLGLYNSNRLGFRGSEDLGGGLRAIFTLESGFVTSTGASDGRAFNRMSWVGLAGPWGMVRMGHTYWVSYYIGVPYDPFESRYSSLSGASAANGGRLDNDIQYAGTFGPVTVRAEHALGEQPNSSSNGATSSLGASYGTPDLYVGGSVRHGTTGTNFLAQDHYTIGGTYRYGLARGYVGYARKKDEVAGAQPTINRYSWLGAKISPTGPWEVTAAYFETANRQNTATGKKDMYMVGVTYNLSKRTNLWAEVDHARMSGTLRPSPAQENKDGYAMGLSHQF